jgi:hypothetical protein
MNDEILLTGFNAICQFVKDLSDEFGKKHKPLRLYNRLISQTKFVHQEAIKRHITIFHAYCVGNREALQTQNLEKLTVDKLVFTPDRVYIDMKYIFNIASDENRKVIWAHLLTISGILDPAGNAKKVLMENKNPEQDFVQNLISKCSADENKISNPAEMMAALGPTFVTDVLGGLQSGKLDIAKLLGTVQGMLANDPEAAPTTEIMGKLVENMNNMQNSPNTPPDLSGIMALLPALFNGVSNNGSGQVDISGMFSALMANLPVKPAETKNKN